LADTARDIGIAGWHAMKKDELVAAIRKTQAKQQRAATTGRSAGTSSNRKANGSKSNGAKTNGMATAGGGKSTAASSGKASASGKTARAKTSRAKSATAGPTGKTSSSKSRSGAGTASKAGSKSTGGKSAGGKSAGGKTSSGGSQGVESKAIKTPAKKTASQRGQSKKTGSLKATETSGKASKSAAAKGGSAASAKSSKNLGKVTEKPSAKSRGKSTASTAANAAADSTKPVERRRRMATKQPRSASQNSTAQNGTAQNSTSQSSAGASSTGPSSTGQKTSGSGAKPVASAAKSPKRAAKPRKPTSPEILKVLRKQQASAESRKDLSACVQVNHADGGDANRPGLKERIVLIVRDSYWLQASWIIARASVERARAAMGADWHSAEPVLRLLEVAHGASANTAEQVVRDIPVHGGVNNWYIDVENPPSRYRVLIGYRATSGRFYTLFRSNIVLTPEPGACDPIDGHWQDIAEDYERIYSLSDNDSGTGSNDLREMFEERLQRPMIDFKNDSAGLDPDLSFRREKDLPFEVDAELIVYGSTAPGASVTLAGAPVRLRPDGTFTVRMELPDRRQVLPVVASSRDGLRQRTTVVAVERNTKVMEPVSKNHMD
jgi:hypothetical protein